MKKIKRTIVRSKGNKYKDYEAILKLFNYDYEIIWGKAMHNRTDVLDENGKRILSPGSHTIERDDESRILTKGDRKVYRQLNREKSLPAVLSFLGDDFEEEEDD